MSLKDQDQPKPLTHQDPLKPMDNQEVAPSEQPTKPTDANDQQEPNNPQR